MWPNESCYSSAVGLERLVASTNSMADSWDWEQNVQDSISLLLGNKWQKALAREAHFRGIYPNLPAMTDVMREQCAIAFYGPPSKVLKNVNANYWVPFPDPKTGKVYQWIVTSDPRISMYRSSWVTCSNSKKGTQV